MTETLTGTFLLPADVLLIPVTDLKPATRARLDCAEGDVAISRPGSRRRSSVVDANSARLIECFRTPSTVVEAIVRFSRETDSDPRVVLERAFDLMDKLVGSGVLLPADDARARRIEGSLVKGDRVGDFVIVDRIQMLEDVELHRAKSPEGRYVALKIGRPGHEDRVRRALAREAAILARLDGKGAPALAASGLDAELPYIAMGWCSGVSPTRAATEFRTRATASRRELLDLCVRVADAYASLHDRDVLHGDVHDKNVLVGPTGEVTLLDFGLAAVPGDPSVAATGRGGVPDYFDPQYAAAQRANRGGPVLDAAADQYSVAALLYFAVRGEPCLELSMRRDEALRQIAEDQPLPFTARGGVAWPELEAVLARALAKDPAMRFDSMHAFAGALRNVAMPVAAPAVVTRSAERARFVDAVIERLDPEGPLYNQGLPLAPYCSVNNGAAGIAYAYYRMAMAREDPAFLANADAWIARAKAWASKTEAWYTLDKLLVKKDLGAIALYHTPTGVHCVEALIALATGEPERAEVSADAYVAASLERCNTLDVTLGKAGVVVGAALMLEASPSRFLALRKRGDAVATLLERKLATFGAMDREPHLTYVGIAHGWSGILWTLVRWRRAMGLAPSDALRGRLDELATLATPRGRGMAWPWSVSPRDVNTEPNPGPTWCNGAAGHVHAWLEAHAAYGDDRYLDLARAAAWNVWDDSRDAIADPCCGLAGRAYSMLAVHRRTGDDAWRRRGEALADRAMDASIVDAPSSHRLYKGALGVAVLLDELERAPESARMPLFESEGWKWQ